MQFEARTGQPIDNGVAEVQDGMESTGFLRNLSSPPNGLLSYGFPEDSAAFTPPTAVFVGTVAQFLTEQVSILAAVNDDYAGESFNDYFDLESDATLLPVTFETVRAALVADEDPDGGGVLDAFLSENSFTFDSEDGDEQLSLLLGGEDAFDLVLFFNATGGGDRVGTLNRVPEPASLALLGAGGALLLGRRRRA